jgi:hypothetical protein
MLVMAKPRRERRSASCIVLILNLLRTSTCYCCELVVISRLCCFYAKQTYLYKIICNLFTICFVDMIHNSNCNWTRIRRIRNVSLNCEEVEVSKREELV